MTRRRRTWLLICSSCGLQLRGVVDAARPDEPGHDIESVLGLPAVVEHMRSCSTTGPAP